MQAWINTHTQQVIGKRKLEAGAEVGLACMRMEQAELHAVLLLQLRNGSS